MIRNCGRPKTTAKPMPLARGTTKLVMAMRLGGGRSGGAGRSPRSRVVAGTGR